MERAAFTSSCTEKTELTPRRRSEDPRVRAVDAVAVTFLFHMLLLQLFLSSIGVFPMTLPPL